MIVAAGLTPAWQQMLTFSSFRTGEVNRAQSVHWCASGKVLNVGCALHHLQTNSRTVSFFGGDTGRLMQAEFDGLGVPTRWIESAIPTRVCTTILDEQTSQTTELVENSQPVSRAELDRFASTFAEEAASAKWVILSGSLPQEAPSDFYFRLMESTSAQLMLDVRGKELLACLPLRPFLVKPNREELALTVQRPLLTDDDVLSAMREVRELGAQRVLVSHGPDEVWLLTSEGVTRFRPPTVDVINPIGCGDCLAAGLTVAYAEGKTDSDAIRFGIGAAVENARQKLPARLDRSRVERMAEAVTLLK